MVIFIFDERKYFVAVFSLKTGYYSDLELHFYGLCGSLIVLVVYPGWEGLVDNNDLIWNLESFGHRQKAMDFVMRFENKLCVYSSSVSQLYTNYTIHFPRDYNHNLVILPNPYAHHDTFQNVPESSVIPTGIHIVPGKVAGKPGLFITLPRKNKEQAENQVRMIPLQLGIDAINKRRPPDSPFLPILIKGDLRELHHHTPYLHLHAIKLRHLGDVSMLDKGSIRSAIEKGLKSIS